MLGIIFISLVGVLHGYGQSLTDSTRQLTGIVTSEEGPLGYATVILKDENNQLIKVIRCNEKGKFTINMEGLDTSKSYNLDVSYIGYPRYLLIGLELRNRESLTINLIRPYSIISRGCPLYRPILQPVDAPSGKTFSREELQRSPFLH